MAVEAQARATRNDVASRNKGRLHPDHPALIWMTEHSSVTMNRLEVSKDGMTAYERCKAKKAKTLGEKLGEAVLWKQQPVDGHLANLTSLWADGVHLGIKSTAGEIVVGTARALGRRDQSPGRNPTVMFLL